MLAFAFAALLPMVEEAPLSLLVQKTEAQLVDPSVTNAVDDVLLSAVAVEGVKVLRDKSGDEGCNTPDCLSEQAQATGATLILFGNVTPLADGFVLALSLFDARTGGTTFDSMTLANASRIPSEVPRFARDLVTAGVMSSPPGPPEDINPLYHLGLAGLIVGGASLVGGGTVAILNEAAIQDPAASGETKRAAQQAGSFGLLLATGGAVLCAAGAVLFVVTQ